MLVVVGHALLGECLERSGRAVALGELQREEPDQLVVPGVVQLVELVAGTELGADRIPEKLHGLDALLVVDVAGAADVASEVFVDLGILEIAGVTGEIDEP